MSKTSRTLILKFILTFLAMIATLFYIDANPLGWVFVVALFGTVVNYLIGDLIILSFSNNLIASVGNGLMAAVIAFVFDLVTVVNITFTSLVFLVIIIAAVEYLFHQYLLAVEEVLPE
ncbi:YndM family protein [Natroniella sulfidigena]|uniref:DUF2512 family protein n=1 Tax=Natroniella sulfidigena TaxID=723921 RepID=UPI00200AA1FA|nr:DUF2512 family protein [Natroniella sulfidigena]MCK8817132.1 YndM family protein [Natroniella sulfidigena]